MADEGTVDRHLGVVLDEVITAIQETKQGVWSATSSDQRRSLTELRSFLISEAVAVAEAEERIGGRDPSLISPTGHELRNLSAEPGNDSAGLLALLVGHLRAIADDVRRRATEIEGAPEAGLFATLADGMDERLDRLHDTGDDEARPDPARDFDDQVENAGRDSFPASDPPGWWSGSETPPD